MFRHFHQVPPSETAATKGPFRRPSRRTSPASPTFWQRGMAGSEIVSSAIDGTDVRRLKKDKGVHVHPTWSPDGTQIAFVSGSRYRNKDLYVMDADGSNMRKIAPTNYIVGRPPAWSPDGSRIAFAGRDESWDGTVYTVRPDGSDLVEDRGRTLKATLSGRLTAVGSHSLLRAYKKLQQSGTLSRISGSLWLTSSAMFSSNGLSMEPTRGRRPHCHGRLTARRLSTETGEIS